MFRLRDESGATLRDVAYAREQAPVAASEPRSKRLTIAIPPGAVSLEVPEFRKPFRLTMEGQR